MEARYTVLILVMMTMFSLKQAEQTFHQSEQDNETEYEIFRDVEIWEGALSKCHEKNGYLVKTSSPEDIERLRRHIRDNEEVWVGTYTTPWLWTKDCWTYTPYDEDISFNITDNNAAKCQRQCGPTIDQVFLQKSHCFCDNSHVTKQAPYNKCNKLCEGDEKDVCGGDGAIMHYRKWYGQNPVLTGISNHTNNCVAMFKGAVWKWRTVSCDAKYQTICKAKKFDEWDYSKSYDTYSGLNMDGQNGKDKIRYEDAVAECLMKNKLIPDIDDNNVKKDKVLKVKKNPSEGIWVGLRRREISIDPFNNTVHVAVETKYNSCHYLVLEDNKMSTYVGNCSQKKSYYCRKLNFKLESEKTSTQKVTGTKPSTTTADIGRTRNGTSSMDNGTFDGHATLGSLTTLADGVTLTQGKRGFSVILVASVGAGILVLIVVIIIAVVCYRRKKRRNHHMPVAFKNVTYDAAMGSENPLSNSRDMSKSTGRTDNKAYSFAEAAYPGNTNASGTNASQKEEDGAYNLLGEIPTNSDAVVSHYSEILPMNGEYSELPVKGAEKPRADFDPYAEEKPENDTYNVLPVKGGPKPDPSFNPYAEEAPDNNTYNVLPVLGGPKVREEFDPYSDEKPDNDTYNVLPVKGQPKTNNDAMIDIYDHTGENADTSQNIQMM